MPKGTRITDTTLRVRKELEQLPDGKLFTTRDMLGCGKRGAVDQALRRMVNAGVLQRVARGVFCKVTDIQYVFDRVGVAMVKARAFGKEVASLAMLATAQDQVTMARAATAVAAAGRGSSFRMGETHVFLRASAPRKIRLGDSKGGLMLRAHWRAGMNSLDAEELTKALTQQVPIPELRWMVDQFRLMPGWLNDCLVPLRPSLMNLAA